MFLLLTLAHVPALQRLPSMPCLQPLPDFTGGEAISTSYFINGQTVFSYQPKNRCSTQAKELTDLLYPPELFRKTTRLLVQPDGLLACSGKRREGLLARQCLLLADRSHSLRLVRRRSLTPRWSCHLSFFLIPRRHIIHRLSPFSLIETSVLSVAVFYF